MTEKRKAERGIEFREREMKKMHDNHQNLIPINKRGWGC
jgi:hypothetical protein